MATEIYKHWKGETVERGTIVQRRPKNKVHIPDELQDTRTNHIYTDVVDENGTPGRAYVAVPYERADNDFPKMVFHPDFHKVLPPNRNHFKESHEWEMAMKDWKEQYDRYQMADTEKDEKRLLGKGWLAKPPIFDLPKASRHSEEI